jgi:hypothetical protein
MGFANQSSQPIPQQDDLEGQWKLVNSEGEVRARGRVLTAGPLEAGQTSYPLVWHGMLEAGPFVLRWGTPAIGTVTTEWERRAGSNPRETVALLVMALAVGISAVSTPMSPRG